MPRLFVGNFEFEHLLANGRYQPSATVKRLNAELAAAWIAVAEDGDWLWCPQPVPADFFDHLHANGLPRVIPVTDLTRVLTGTELVPWGWTDAWMQTARKFGWSYSAPNSAVVRTVNSRRFSFDLETEWQIPLPGAVAIGELSQFDSALHRAKEIAPGAVIKANWGMSGRERILVHAELTESQRSWVRKRLQEQGVIFVEPWVRREEEAGIQIQIPQHGPPQLIGITALVCDSLGQYRGSWFTDPPHAGTDFRQRWQPAVDFALAAAERMQHLGYFGSVGIDALRYRDADGTIGFRPLQDINARWTMGRLSLGWRRFLQPGESGFWQHGPPDCSEELISELPKTLRIIETSPVEIGGRPVEHRSRLAIFDQ